MYDDETRRCQGEKKKVTRVIKISRRKASGQEGIKYGTSHGLFLAEYGNQHKNTHKKKQKLLTA